MEIQIAFANHKDISPDLTIPDILEYYIILPETFTDAETGSTLLHAQSNQTVILP